MSTCCSVLHLFCSDVHREVPCVVTLRGTWTEVTRDPGQHDCSPSGVSRVDEVSHPVARIAITSLRHLRHTHDPAVLSDFTRCARPSCIQHLVITCVALHRHILTGRLQYQPSFSRSSLHLYYGYVVSLHVFTWWRVC